MKNQEKLKTSLISLHKELRKEMNEKWRRTLPFGDELFDRWEKASFLGFGSKTNIYDSSVVIGDVKVGENTWIGPFTLLDGSHGLTIGNNCSISSGVQIYTHDTVDKRISDSRKDIAHDSTIIGNSCYIGPLSIISKGVSLGNYCVVGALSFVNNSFPPYTIIAGIPAKKIGEIKIDIYGNVSRIYKSVKPEHEEKIKLLEKEIKNLKTEIAVLKDKIYGEEN